MVYVAIRMIDGDMEMLYAKNAVINNNGRMYLDIPDGSKKIVEIENIAEILILGTNL